MRHPRRWLRSGQPIGRHFLAPVIERIKQRLDAEPNRAAVGELWTATKIYLGLRYESQFVDQLLQGVRAMKESTTYQAIKEEGRLEGRQEGRLEGREEGRREEVRRLLLRLGKLQFGTSPTPEQETMIEAITETDRLEELLLRAGRVGTWIELLK